MLFACEVVHHGDTSRRHIDCPGVGENTRAVGRSCAGNGHDQPRVVYQLAVPRQPGVRYAGDHSGEELQRCIGIHAPRSRQCAAGRPTHGVGSGETCTHQRTLHIGQHRQQLSERMGEMRRDRGHDPLSLHS